ncbi:MAG TPA: divergent polysaccharide deacetylase family protein, partial [Candidatus Baltobacteraceae bacterium]
MPRKRSRRRRSNPAPLLLIALILAVAVGWAIFPRGHRRSAPHHTVAIVTASASPQAIVTASPSPAATQTEAPSAPPSAPLPAQSPPAGGAQVAIIIDDCGQWLDAEEALIALPIPVTLSVLPHVPYTARIASEAAAA